MLFTTPLFIVFASIVILAHSLVKTHTQQKILLLCASYAFYAAWQFPTGVYFLPLLIFSSGLDYFIGKTLHNLNRQDKEQRIGLLIISLCVNLGMLALFKYAGFFADIFNTLSGHETGSNPSVISSIILPLGISFFTFQSMSYTIDAYRKQGAPYTSVVDFMLFVAFFPQLIAGPIVRADYFLKELENRHRPGYTDIDKGIRIMLVGYLLKVLLADNVAIQTDRLFNSINLLSSGDALLAMYGFSIQIFGDFAGYSLIAIGLARCFGITLPQNFNRPYLATGFRDFWRRWHITLSTWLRDYLYIPLGGSKKGMGRMLWALVITMFLGGLWHGAGWTFIIWGLAHGCLLVAETLGARAMPGIARWMTESKCGKAVAIFTTFHITSLLWILFRAESVGDALIMYKLLAKLPFEFFKHQPLYIESYYIAVFLIPFFLYHLIARRELPELRILRLKPVPATLFIVCSVLLIQVFWVGKISFIYFAF